MKHMNVKWVDGIVVIEPKGSGRSLWGGEETEELAEVLDTLDKEATQHALVNLGQITLVNSLALATLVRAHMRFRARGAVIKLSNLSDRLTNVFVITRLCFVFDVYETEREAIESFKLDVRDQPEQPAVQLSDT